MNALIDRNDLPSFRVQLGCSGFVIIDENGYFITTKSKAFLDYGDTAFYEVEALLRTHSNAFKNDESQSTQQLKQSNTNTSEEKKIDLPTSISALPAIGHAEMDEEHDKIVEYINILLQEKSRRALEKVKIEFMEHSSSEEELLSQLGFGSIGGGGDLSPLKSHADDHKRIINVMDTILGRSSTSVAAIDIIKVNDVIHLHAERFDTIYAEYISNISSSSAPS